jgi:hypothetical protein
MCTPLIQNSGLCGVKVCPEVAEVVEVICVLAEPAHICQVLLTTAHGADDTTSPVSFDLRVGRTLDELHLVLEVSFPSTEMYFLCVVNFLIFVKFLNCFKYWMFEPSGAGDPSFGCQCHLV